ncbi:MAG TPA: HPF/RaiA family ribosome-associated protein [Sphingomicrobium sp.]|nr:HPF/RaiA family ribosome-associated protein [Sphingomicrobium sp.]
MDVRVADHQVTTGDTLHAIAAQRIAEITEKYFARAVGANVTFGRGPNNEYSCDILAPVARGVVLKASHHAREPQMAFNGAADRIEKQLRRYVKRLRDRKGNGADQPYEATAGYTIFAPSPEAEEPPANPVIIAETKVDIPEASVSDAVMLLDLRNTGALMFKNSATGQYNMIYRRDDGSIGWVEPRAD